jgi:hypothetical protein
MRLVKIFKGVESDISTLEKEVNTWVRESGATLLGITGNIAPQTITPSTKGGLGQNAFPPSDVILIAIYEPPGN